MDNATRMCIRASDTRAKKAYNKILKRIRRTANRGHNCMFVKSLKQGEEFFLRKDGFKLSLIPEKGWDITW